MERTMTGPALLRSVLFLLLLFSSHGYGNVNQAGKSRFDLLINNEPKAIKIYPTRTRNKGESLNPWRDVRRAEIRDHYDRQDGIRVKCVFSSSPVSSELISPAARDVNIAAGRGNFAYLSPVFGLYQPLELSAEEKEGREGGEGGQSLKRRTFWSW